MGRLTLRQRRLLARGISPYRPGPWGRSSTVFLSLGIGNRAKTTLGTGNSSYLVTSRKPGTTGNSTTFRIVVAGNNTAASVSVVGSAVTFNSATNGSAAAASTVNEMIRLVNGDQIARPLVHVQRASGSDGTGTVAAVAATTLTGAV